MKPVLEAVFFLDDVFCTLDDSFCTLDDSFCTLGDSFCTLDDLFNCLDGNTFACDVLFCMLESVG